MNQQLQKIIMRRVYYAVVIRLATHPLTAYGVAFVALGWWLKELVFVARVWQSFVATPVGELGSFVYGLVSGADLLTLTVFAAACCLIVAFLRSLERLRSQTVQLQLV